MFRQFDWQIYEPTNWHSLDDRMWVLDCEIIEIEHAVEGFHKELDL
jgi:hypothetical protein